MRKLAVSTKVRSDSVQNSIQRIAVPMLNHRCFHRFTKLRPYFEIRKADDVLTEAGNDLYKGLGLEPNGFVCVLHMPHKTPYYDTPFFGSEKNSEERAKRSVALDACKKLHQDGLLDERLLPIKRKR